ncbi:MAG: tryptophan 7-halogenase [Methylococcaceae bacterium]|nr:tryptophan 7-halogenase [Methylococcaceae bacterium]
MTRSSTIEDPEKPNQNLDLSGPLDWRKRAIRKLRKAVIWDYHPGLSIEDLRFLFRRAQAMQQQELKSEYDVVICGGGLAGLTLAKHLDQTFPELSVAVIEKTLRPLPEAGFKVGESSVEGGSNYIGRILGLHDYMKEKHFLKNGLRFFPGRSDLPLEKRPELGPPRLPILPAYQIDRGVFENDVREMLIDQGIQLFEGYGLREFELGANGSRHTIRVQKPDSDEVAGVSCRWLVDASGRRFFLQSKFNTRNRWEHKLDACWFRVEGRFDINDFVPRGKWHEERDPGNIRYFSTNHLMGHGYWVWVIPLGSGHTSIGIVAAEEHHPLEERSRYETALEWLKKHEPVIAQHLDGKTPLDFRCFKNCSYGSSRTFSADRWACVGEAGVFLDPLYSYGLDFIAMSNNITVEMIRRDLSNELTPAAVEEFNHFYLTLTNNLMQLFNGAYHIFDKAHVMMAKVYWDTGFYWGFFAPLSFFKVFQKPELLSRMNYMKNTLALNLRMQQLFKDWARMPSSTQAPGFTRYPHLYSYLSRAHVELSRNKSQERALRDMEKNCRMLEDTVRVWFLRAVESTMPEKLASIKARGRLNPYAVSLHPERWEEDGLFDAEPNSTSLMEKDVKVFCGELKLSKLASLYHLFRLYLWGWTMKTVESA